MENSMGFWRPKKVGTFWNTLFDIFKSHLFCWETIIPRDPGSPSENGFMEPKYYAFWR